MIDYNKAFDSLSYQFILKALKNQGIPNKLITIVTKMYSGLIAKINIDNEGRLFNIKKGFKQGDPLSPLLFSCALEEIFRGLDLEGTGLNINGEKITNLQFASDVVLLANNKKEIINMIENICKRSKVAGLTINTDKTVKLRIHLQTNASNKPKEQRVLEQIVCTFDAFAVFSQFPDACAICHLSFSHFKLSAD